MKQKHINAIQALVTEYCNSNLVVPRGHQLEVLLSIRPVGTVSVSIAEDELDQVFAMNLYQAIGEWLKKEKSKGDHKTRFVWAMEHRFNRNHKVGDFCRLNETEILRWRNVGRRTLLVAKEFLRSLNPKLEIGCAKHHEPFPWEEDAGKPPSLADLIAPHLDD